jgi:hypothetical protein
MCELPWRVEALELFQDLMQTGPPATFQEKATRAIRNAALNVARARDAAVVDVQDVALACLRIAPPAFRPNVIDNLARRGIDVGGAPAAAHRAVTSRHVGET